MNFNPNKPALTKNYFWATYIPSRHPEFKLHTGRGPALNAFAYGRAGILYEWNLTTSEWVERSRVESKGKPQPTSCEHCGRADKMRYPRWKWVDKHTDNPRMLEVCSDCERALRRR